MTTSRHISIGIARPAAEVYDYAADPASLAEWAPGLGHTVERVDGRWYVQTPGGRARLDFAPRNGFGVLDHTVYPPGSEPVYVPLRVLAAPDGCEVVFTLRRAPGMTDAELDRDAELVGADLARLKRIAESR
ncbi:MAG TPA: SRPBCC family protein [Actinocatenispora sp.]